MKLLDLKKDFQAQQHNPTVHLVSKIGSRGKKGKKENERVPLARTC